MSSALLNRRFEITTCLTPWLMIIENQEYQTYQVYRDWPTELSFFFPGTFSRILHSGSASCATLPTFDVMHFI